MSIAKTRNVAVAPVRLAILGGGAVTQELYLPALRSVPEVEAVVVVDADPDAVRRLRAIGHDGPVLTARADDFFADRKRRDALGLEAVVVALPNACHESATIQALECGLSVLCEKPLALSAAACRRMTETADASGKVAAVGMVRRLSAAVAACREALAAGLIGTVTGVDAEDGTPFGWLSDTGAFFRPENGGVLADMGAHYLDLLQELVGQLRPVRYRDDWRGGCEANCTYELVTADGVPVRLALSRDRTLRNAMVITGNKGELVLTKDDFAACLWRPAGQDLEARLTPTRLPDGGEPPATFLACFARQFAEFAQAVRGDRPVQSTLEQAARVTGLIEWAYDRRDRDSEKRPAAPSGPSLDAGAAVVTGGTGFIGGRLVERLTELDCQPLVVPVRNYHSCVESARFPVVLPRINLLDAADARRAVQGARYVFHLAYGNSGRDAARVTVQGTRNVVEAAIAAGAEAVVVLSTMYVFGHPDTDAEVDETWPYDPAGGEYGRSKMRMERWCLKRAADSGRTRIAVLNPSCVYGVGGKTYTRLPVLFAQAGQFCWVEDGRGTANYTYVDNLIDAIVLAARTPEVHGRRLIINDGCCTWRELLEPMLGPWAEEVPSYTVAELRTLACRAAPRARLRDVLRAAARSRELIDAVDRFPVAGRLKRGLLRLIPRLRVEAPSTLQCAVAAANANHRPVPPDWLADVFGPTRTRFSAAQARSVLGWAPRVTLAEGQARAVEWLRTMRFLDNPG
jgi:predicted dehydrogenase/nucleoside-diphosphate-sugar epimerase